MDNVFVVEEFCKYYRPIGKWVVRARFREDEEVMAHSVLSAYINAYSANNVHMRLRHYGPNGWETIFQTFWQDGKLYEKFGNEPVKELLEISA